jgi:hypothetical protein
MPPDVPGEKSHPAIDQHNRDLYPTPSRDASAEIESPKRADLERRKLDLEVCELERSPWLKPNVTIPLLAALATRALSQYLGVFDVARKQVELQAKEARFQRDKLSDEIAQLEPQKQALKQQAAALDERKSALATEAHILQERVVALSQDIDDKNAALKVATQQLEAMRHTLNETVTALGSPRIDFAVRHLTVARETRFTIINSGHGVAEIRHLQWYVDGKPVDGGQELKTKLGLRNEDFRHIRIRPPAEVGTGERIDLLLLNRPRLRHSSCVNSRRLSRERMLKSITAR